MKYATKKTARDIIEQYKDRTGFFDGSLNMADMTRMFRDMHFGEAETNVIMAALVLVDGKFTVE